MNFKLTDLNSFEDNIRREWALTNGLGSYAGSSVIGAHNRTHQGYLIASLRSPVMRYLFFSKTNEKVTIGNNVYDFTTAQYKGRQRICGQTYLKEFNYDGTVCYTYEIPGMTIKKHISLVYGLNRCAIGYEIINNTDSAIFTVTPLLNYREHSGSSTIDDLKFTIFREDTGFSLIPDANPNIRTYISVSDGILKDRESLYEADMELQTEVDNEVAGLDCHFTPFDIEIAVPANSSKRISLICDVIPASAGIVSRITPDTAFDIIDAQLKRVSKIIDNSGLKDDFGQALAVAADQFITQRESTGYSTVLAGLPWFTDWGRDTMIAFTGLTLCTGRFNEAHDILLTFAKYCHNGLIPNMFPDNGQKPLYNTADASLWYFYAVYKYLMYTGNSDDYDFIYKEIYPSLKEIISAYKNGTDFSIYMDEDYLIHAGSGLDQVTWMDVRVGDWVATPRHGKPVEINALWYNALCIMDFLSAKFGENDTDYKVLSEKVRSSFIAKFWNPNAGCLYDVVDETPDDSIRPNQIYAVSLPFTMLDHDMEKSIVNVVKNKLYVGCGLRSLDPEHKDYHPIYIGSLSKRDHAYHQGTAWGFLLGGFITAYVKVNGSDKKAADEALKLLEPVKDHLYHNCIGSICEIFDGDSPHNGRGCYAQAWSVGEVLRCYFEDILPFKTRA